MENDILDALSDIGYDGPLLKSEELEKALEGGPKSTDYTSLVHKLSSEIKDLYRLEEAVSETSGPEEAIHFVLELSSFLKELGCPYLSLVTGHMSSRLQKRSDKLLLLDFLLSELMAARMLAVDKPQDNDSSMDVTIHETPTAKDLNTIVSALKMTQPPSNIAPTLLFTKLKDKLKSVLQQRGSDFVGRPAYNQAVSEKQWKELEELYNKLIEEYKLRREMLITRLDCTIQSFEWKGGKGDNKNNKIQTIYQPLRQQMKVHPSVRLSDFLAARSTLLAMRKTSDAAVRINTRSDVNKVVIGRVPDRGGRPSEQQPPPPEMPSWQQQRSQGGGRGGGQGGRGGGSGFGGGGRVQGGWNPQDQRGDQRNNSNQGYQDNRGGRGGYQGNRGGHQDNRGGYQDNRGSYQDNRGGYPDNRSGNQDNRGGFQDNRGGYQDNRGGYQDNRGGYQNSRGGYQDNRGGYQDSRGGYQDNRNSRGGYQDNSTAYSGSKTYVVQNEPYSNNQGYQSNQGYQQSNQGYQSNRGGYKNEHDDRTNTGYDNRGGSGRGRSNYNRGGRR